MSPENAGPTVSIHTLLRRISSARGARALSALSLMTLLAGSLAACDDMNDDGFGRRDAFGRYDGRRDRDRWDRDGRRSHRGAPGTPDAATDAGSDQLATDAGDTEVATNAGDASLVGQPVAADLLDAGASDAATPSGVAALSDAQILLVADELLVGGIALAQAASPRLAEPDAAAFAQRLIDEHAAARNTLEPVGDAIGATPAASVIADDVSASNAARVATLTAPDAGALDALYLEATLAEHVDALALVSELIAASDAAPLRAQLVVVQAVLEVQLARARQIEAAL